MLSPKTTILHRFLAFLLVFALAIPGAVPVQAQEGSRYSTLSTGANSTVDKMVMDQDGDLYVAGAFSWVGGEKVNNVTLWDGSDFISMDGGIEGVPSLSASAVDQEGNLWVGGSFDLIGGKSVRGLAVWDGNEWYSPGDPSSSVRAIVVASDGDVYVAGQFSKIGNVNANNIARWDGSQWHALNGGLDGLVYALEIDAEGNLYAGGTFTQADGTVEANRVAKWDGEAWSAMGSGFDYTVNALAVSESGDIYAGGSFYFSGMEMLSYVARWDGTAWVSMGGGMNQPVSILETDADGRLYAGGYFSRAGGVTAYGLAVWNGVEWSAVPGGTGDKLSARVTALYHHNGSLYVGGSFTVEDGAAGNMLIRWDGTSWSEVLPGQRLSASVDTIEILPSGELFLGGGFTTNNSISSRGIAKWDAQQQEWVNLNGGTTTISSVVAMAIHPITGDLYVGGSFSSIGGVTATRLARWDGSSWVAVPGAPNQIVNSMAFDQAGNLYIGGSFTKVGGKDIQGVARYDGSNWSQVGNLLPGTIGKPVVRDMAFDPAGNLFVVGEVYLEGEFSSGYGVAKWDGESWTTLGNANIRSPKAIAIDPSGNVWIGGDFTEIRIIEDGTGNPTLPANGLAMWNGAFWTGLGQGLEDYAIIKDIYIHPVMGHVYVAGTFQQINGERNIGVARWDGVYWAGLGGGLSSDASAVVGNPATNDLYIGGAFLMVDGFMMEAQYVARYDMAFIGTDSTPPVFSDVVLSETGLTNQPVGVTVSVGDADSGLDGLYCRLGYEPEFTYFPGTTSCTRVATENTTFEYYAVDRAGNSTGVVVFFIDNIDLLPPAFPTNIVPTNGVPSGYCQPTQKGIGVSWEMGDPAGLQSPVQVYVGQDPFGDTPTSTLNTLDNFFSHVDYGSGRGVGMYYLRVQATDRFGNQSPWMTIYRLCLVENEMQSIITTVDGGELAQETAIGTQVQAVFPQASVDADTLLEYSPDASAAQPPAQDSGLVEAVPAFTLNAYDLASRQPVTSFSTAYTMTVQYDESQTGGLPEEDLSLYYWDEGSSAWVAIPSTLDAENNTLSANVDHLTEFAVFGAEGGETPGGGETGESGGTITIVGQPRSILAEDIIFEAVTLNGLLQVSDGTTQPWTAINPTGTGEAWHLTISATGFEDGAGHNISVEGFSAELADENISLVAGNIKPVSKATSGITLAPLAQTLMTAAENTGMGSYTLVPTFSLSVPPSTYAGTYLSVVEVSLVSGP